MLKNIENHSLLLIAWWLFGSLKIIIFLLNFKFCQYKNSSVSHEICDGMFIFARFACLIDCLVLQSLIKNPIPCWARETKWCQLIDTAIWHAAFSSFSLRTKFGSKASVVVQSKIKSAAKFGAGWLVWTLKISVKQSQNWNS